MPESRIATALSVRVLALITFLPAAPDAQAEPVIIVTGRALADARGEDVYDRVEIGRERLSHAPSNRLEDVLRDVPGFQQFRRSDGRSANPTSQGATFRALGGNASSRALLILDGVPQSDPFGGWIGWPAYDPRRLGRIRVTRGGGGAAGPGALAGTIEMDSAPPGDSAGLDAALAYGSRDSVEAFATYGMRVGEGFAGLSASFGHGDGFVPVVARQRGPADRPAPYRQASVAGRALVPVSGSAELQANLSAFTDRRERGTAFSAIGSDGADASLRLVGRGRLPFSALVYVQTRSFSTLFASVDPARASAVPVLDQYHVPSTGTGVRLETRPSAGPVELRFGADWRGVEGRTREHFQFVAGAPTRGRVAGGRADNFGAFAEAGLERGPLTLGGGVRIDRWRIAGGHLRERLLADGAPLTDAAFPDRGGWEPTGRLGIAWRSGAATLRAAGFLGWRQPTLNELYRPFRVGADATAANAALTPERLSGAEAGLILRPIAGIRLGVTLFANRLRHAIANVTLSEGPGTFPGVGFVPAGGQYRMRFNLDAIDSRGIEADAEIGLGSFSLQAGYSFAAARVRASGVAVPLDGLRPAQAPRHSASATFAWRSASGPRASASLRYVSRQYEDDLNRQAIPAALTIDAHAAIPLVPHLAVELRGENLAGEEVVTAISGLGIVERATPRTLWIGLRWGG